MTGIETQLAVMEERSELRHQATMKEFGGVHKRLDELNGQTQRNTLGVQANRLNLRNFKKSMNKHIDKPRKAEVKIAGGIAVIVSTIIVTVISALQQMGFM